MLNGVNLLKVLGNIGNKIQPILKIWHLTLKQRN